MSENFNRLTAAQAERFAILAEEASEVIQLCMKILRHGRLSHHPDDPDRNPNHKLLTGELADFLAVMHDLADQGDIRAPNMAQIQKSLEKKKRFTHHQAA